MKISSNYNLRLSIYIVTFDCEDISIRLQINNNEMNEINIIFVKVSDSMGGLIENRIGWIFRNKKALSKVY